jgi:hypothetical protein
LQVARQWQLKLSKELQKNLLHKIERENPPKPFVNHVMLTHQWRKLLSAWWCKHSNIFIAREIKPSSRCYSWYDTTFAWTTIVTTSPQIEVTQNTKFTQLKLAMTMLAKMQILFAISTISTCCYDDLRDGTKRTWICLHKMWNLAFLAMKVKMNCIVCDNVFSFMNTMK